MPNPIKYSTGSETLSLKKGNFFIGTGDVGKGPSDVTGYYQGVDVPSSGYTIYLYNETAPGNLSYHVANNDEELISFTNNLSNNTFTSTTQCFNYFATQTNSICFNTLITPIITDNLIYYIDAEYVQSYPRSGNTIYNLSITGNNSSLINGTSYTTGNTPSFSFDGSNDFISFVTPPNISTGFTYNIWFNKTQSKNSAALISIQGTLLQVDNSTVSWWSNVNVGPRTYNITPTLNKWYNILISQNNTECSIYLDSNLIISGATSSPNLTGGRNTIGGWGGSDRVWLGDISLVQVYNKPLSYSEMLQNYEAIGIRYVTFDLQYMVVAGGGGGGQGSYPSGGGGAGGLLTGYTTTLSTNTNYTITVGAGGNGSNGSNSVFNDLTSIGGGRGGNGRSASGVSGGSGGGGATNYPPDLGAVKLTPAGSGTFGQGNNGGVGKSVYNNTGPNGDGIPSGAGGGGGAGGVGGTGTTVNGVQKGGDGGIGLYFSEYSSFGGTPSGWFAGGGGGSNDYANGGNNNGIGLGGNGGGGNASNAINGGIGATSGGVNTGGGGGGGGYGNRPAGSGGSGIIIIRIPDVYTAKFSSGVSASVTKSGGYKYYKVTATSTTSETVSFS